MASKHSPDPVRVHPALLALNMPQVPELCISRWKEQYRIGLIDLGEAKISSRPLFPASPSMMDRESSLDHRDQSRSPSA